MALNIDAISSVTAKYFIPATLDNIYMNNTFQAFWNPYRTVEPKDYTENHHIALEILGEYGTVALTCSLWSEQPFHAKVEPPLIQNGRPKHGQAWSRGPLGEYTPSFTVAINKWEWTIQNVNGQEAVVDLREPDSIARVHQVVREMICRKAPVGPSSRQKK